MTRSYPFLHPMTQPDWFTHWFDSPYYSMLYRQRDEREAADFATSLVNRLALAPGSKILDLACGRGRHAIALHAMGFDVTGIDLSTEAIQEASNHQSPGLQFLRADMRSFSLGRSFSLVINLFTSFGYFDSIQDNLAVLANVRAHLLRDGTFILDYFNGALVTSQLVAAETITTGNVAFRIKRRVEPGHIVKEIQVHSPEGEHTFSERVQLFDKHQLTEMLLQCGLAPFDCYGDYQLSPFDPICSPRLILAAKAV